MQDAETALENVHDRVVYAFPVVDDFIVVDTGNEEDGAVVLTCLVYALFLRLVRVPSPFLGIFFFHLRDKAQEFDVTRGKQIPTSVYVNDPLARLHTFAFYKLVELALFFFYGPELRGRRVDTRGAWAGRRRGNGRRHGVAGSCPA